MTKLKWTYVAKGHYSAPATRGWTTHVLASGIVYKTHPTHKTVDITGAKADRYTASLGGKMRTKSKRVEKKPPKTPTIRKPTKRQIKRAAKVLASGAGKVLGTVGAFTTQIGEAEEAAYKRRQSSTPAKRTKPKKQREQTLEEYLGF